MATIGADFSVTQPELDVESIVESHPEDSSIMGESEDSSMVESETRFFTKDVIGRGILRHQTIYGTNNPYERGSPILFSSQTIRKRRTSDRGTIALCGSSSGSLKARDANGASTGETRAGDARGEAKGVDASKKTAQACPGQHPRKKFPTKDSVRSGNARGRLTILPERGVSAGDSGPMTDELLLLDDDDADECIIRGRESKIE